MSNPKYRRYSIMLYKRIDNDYLPAELHAIDVFRAWLRPCIHDICGWIAAMFPNMEIDERDERLRDMLNSADIVNGVFSVSLRKPEDPREITYKLGFLEL